ncbi:MAG TPA: creatininase family protein, partial [Rhizomicrobium sp.]
MQLHLCSWPEVEAYLQKSKTILIPIGSTEQHGPTGLMGTDAICAEVIGRRAGEETGIMVAPTFNVGQAQHHMAFAGTMTLRPSTMIAAMVDWARSLSHHGFERLYWLNGHGGNIATMTAAFSEIYHTASLSEAKGGRVLCKLRNWWELPGVGDTARHFFPVGEGHHATPSEISVTYYAYPHAQKQA